ncbi:MAG: hypothetical protein IKM07_01625 [Clostridia bacterium]|nr:hypothetical protein [Clostridia bacterium]
MKRSGDSAGDLRREIRRSIRGEAARDARRRWIEENRERLLDAVGTGDICPAAMHFASMAAAQAVQSGQCPTEKSLAAALAAYPGRERLEEQELWMLVPALRREFARRALAEDADGAVRTVCAQALGWLENTPQLAARLQELGTLHGLLSQDGVYARMDRESRQDCRKELARLAKCHRIREAEAAALVLRLSREARSPHAQQVCHFIWEEPLGNRRSHVPARIYRAGLIILPVLLTMALWPVCGVRAVFAYPAWLVLAKEALSRLLMRLTPSVYIPLMEKGTRRTLCAGVVLLHDEKQIRGLEQQLEEAYLAGVCPEERGLLKLAILADLPDAPHAQMPGDELLIETAAEVIRRLESRWGKHFCLLVRGRSYNASQGCWMGYERKRGAVLEALALLRGRENALQAAAGDPAILAGCESLIVLDADTRVDAGSLSVLMRAASHPSNRPVLSLDGRRVEHGYGILQPRLETDPESLQRSGFSRLFGGLGGSIHYREPVSELAQRLYGSANFTGKGIISVKAADAVLSGVFPENTVLSHDYPEGILLRTAIVGQAAFTDGFPGGSTAYYKRLHRWIRGDTQNLRITRLLPHFAKMHIRGLLGQNLWPAYVVHLITMAVWSQSAWMKRFLPEAGMEMQQTAWLLLPVGLALLLPLIGTRARRCLSPVSVGVMAAVGRELARFMLLPITAWVQVSAVFTALRRMYGTHRGMLEWVTAGQAEGKNAGSIRERCRRVLPCILSAAAVLAAGNAAGWWLGLLWLSAPALLWRLDQKPAGEDALSASQKAALCTQAGQMLGYYLDHMNAESAFLPPDNVQEQPAGKRAPRTSPTNIGLAMLSLQASVELGLLEQATALERLEGCVETLERLEKWHGQLYNWYEIPSCRVLEPQMVSTVDCGNLAVSLVSLERSLMRTGNARAEALAARIRALREPMDFAPLYDERRGLLRLGWDVPHDAPAPGHYDLMAGEHRLASYYAIAMGQIPQTHWRQLSRRLVGAYGYAGLVSWTGTCFEYLLPQLFLPKIPGTLWDETVRLTALAQRRWAQDVQMPWGVSESAYFAFDESLDYQYKAHGVPALGLARGLGQEAVAAPYAAYLLLTAAPQEAMAALARYEGWDMQGRYGLYEALDMTRRRLGPASRGMPVRCHMAHHIGMSILSIHHVLTGAGTVRDFMAEPRMGAFRSLLRERIPVHERVARMPGTDRELPGYHAEPEGFLCRIAEYDAFFPFGTVLGNGAYRMYLSNTGLTYAVFRRHELYRANVDTLGRQPGLQVFLHDDRGVCMSLTPSPTFDDAVRYSSCFDGCSSMIGAVHESYRTRMTARVSLSEPGEQRCLRITNTGKARRQVCVTLRLRPSLTLPGSGSQACGLCTQGRALHWERKVSDWEVLHACMLCDTACGWELQADGTAQAVVNVFLEGGQSQEITFSLACGESRTQALEAAQRCLSLTGSGASRRMDALASVLGLSHEDVSAAWEMYAELFFLTPAFRKNSAHLQANTLGAAELTRRGLSADLPLLALRLPKEEKDAWRVLEQTLRLWLFLYCSGAFAEFLVFTRDGENFERTQQKLAAALLEDWNAASLVDCRGGIRLLDEGNLTKEERESMTAQASLFLDGEEFVKPRRQYRKVFPWERENLPDKAEKTLESPSFHCEYDAYGCIRSRCRHARGEIGVPGSECITLVHGKKRMVFPGTGEKSESGEKWLTRRLTMEEGTISLTEFLHPTMCARILLFEGENIPENAQLEVYMPLQLGENPEQERTVLTWRDEAGGGLYARNPGVQVWRSWRCLAAFRSRLSGPATGWNMCRTGWKGSAAQGSRPALPCG